MPKIIPDSRYKLVAAFFAPEVVSLNKARLQWVAGQAEKSRPFLLRLQARHPLIHELYERCVELFNRVGSAIFRPEKIPTCGAEVAGFDLDNEENLKPSWQAAYVDVTKETLQGVPMEKKKKLYRELKAATIEQLQYLQSHLPYKSDLVPALMFAHPLRRNLDNLQTLALFTARALKRFSSADEARIATQINAYQYLPQVPPFDPMKDRVDHWWREMFKQLEEELMEPPLELARLVKLVLSLPHGQAMVESGFSTTKHIVAGRERLGDQSVKGQKLVTSVVRAAGGAHNVPITFSLLNAVKTADIKHREDVEKEKEKKRKAEEAAAGEAESKKKKEEADAAKATWEEKKASLEEKVKVVKDEIATQNKVQDAALGRLERTKTEVMKKSCVKTIKESKESIRVKTEVQEKLMKQLARHMAKKPKV